MVCLVLHHAPKISEGFVRLIIFKTKDKNNSWSQLLANDLDSSYFMH